VARIDNPMLIPFWVNPGLGLIGQLCVELIALLFGSLVSSLAIIVLLVFHHVNCHVKEVMLAEVF